MSVSHPNSIAIIDIPGLEYDTIFCKLSITATCSSIGTVTCSSISWGATPSHSVLIVTVGYEISGIRFIGSLFKLIRPKTTIARVTINVVMGLFTEILIIFIYFTLFFLYYFFYSYYLYQHFWKQFQPDLHSVSFSVQQL